ncbi:MAG: methionyl-tRNA formyltransferase [Muribaculaceae bacterium]|nr:methionyl-tRNA formyltransferase [Muribaculaceae bacterium]
MEKKKLRIVFLGTPEFAVESLDRIHSAGYDIAAVVTMPDKPAGRGHKLLQSPVKQWAVAHDIKVLQPARLKDPAFVDELRSLNANLFVVIAFRMLPEIVWQMPELGTFNLHASLLPRYRGAAPINHAVMNGDTKTGVTTFFLKHEIDTGDIIAQRSIDIAPDEDAGSVHDRLMLLGADLTLETLQSIVNGTLRTISQDELLTAGEEPTPAPKIFRETCEIDWNRTAAEIQNHVRGLAPYPAAWTRLTLPGQTDAIEVKVLKVKTSDNSQLAPGEVTAGNGKLTVGCSGKTAIEILELKAEGKRAMPAADFLRGLHL